MMDPSSTLQSVTIQTEPEIRYQNIDTCKHSSLMVIARAHIIYVYIVSARSRNNTFNDDDGGDGDIIKRMAGKLFETSRYTLSRLDIDIDLYLWWQPFVAKRF